MGLVVDRINIEFKDRYGGILRVTTNTIKNTSDLYFHTSEDDIGIELSLGQCEELIVLMKGHVDKYKLKSNGG